MREYRLVVAFVSGGIFGARRRESKRGGGRGIRAGWKTLALPTRYHLLQGHAKLTVHNLLERGFIVLRRGGDGGEKTKTTSLRE